MRKCLRILTERSDPIVEGDQDDVSVQHELRSEDISFTVAGSLDETATVDEHHDRFQFLRLNLESVRERESRARLRY